MLQATLSGRLGVFVPILLALTAAAGGAEAETFEVVADDQTVLSVNVLGAGGSPRLLWPNILSGGPPGVERTRQHLVNAGFEVWLADPLEARFLPRSSENVRSLDGSGIAALLGATANHPDQPTLMVAHGRMALPVLRGTRLWQQQGGEGRLDGIVLLYPNLFGPTPAAGDDPQLDPIVDASNWPLMIVQPERGTLRWALPEVMDRLWNNQSRAFATLIPGVRDWYLFHEPGQDPLEDAAAAELPELLQQALTLLGSAPRPETAVQSAVADSSTAATESDQGQATRVTGLRERPGQPPAPDFHLEDTAGAIHRLDEYSGAVTLVNFWASWCPPCVEEIPSMNRLAARYDQSAFRIVSINFQEDPETIRAFMRRVQVDFPVLIDTDGAVSRQWRVIAFPSSFIVDARGRVRWSVNSAIAWDEPHIFQLIEGLMSEGQEQ